MNLYCYPNKKLKSSQKLKITERKMDPLQNISPNKPGKISKNHRGNHKNVTDKAGKTTLKRLLQLEPLQSISIL